MHTLLFTGIVPFPQSIWPVLRAAMVRCCPEIVAFWTSMTRCCSETVALSAAICRNGSNTFSSVTVNRTTSTEVELTGAATRLPELHEHAMPAHFALLALKTPTVVSAFATGSTISNDVAPYGAA
jgi:hypothetical protein